MAAEKTLELRALEEKLRALATLIRHEQEFQKLRFYKREFDLVAAKLREAERTLLTRKDAKVIPFARKKHRSA